MPKFSSEVKRQPDAGTGRGKRFGVEAGRQVDEEDGGRPGEMCATHSASPQGVTNGRRWLLLDG